MNRSSGVSDTLGPVTSWADFAAAEPDFATRAQALFDAGRHKTIATLSGDGSPRISGIECEFVADHLQFGTMPDARKGADLARDPRFALHGPTFHPEVGKEHEWVGEAKVTGRAESAGPILGDDAGEGPKGEMFTTDIESVAITGLDDTGTRLRIEWWTPSSGRQVLERD